MEKAAGPDDYRLFCADDPVFLFPAPAASVRVVSLAGALAAIILSWFYVPFLAKAALAANKKVPLYYQEKDYVFHEDYLTFSSEGVDPLNIPYDRFTTLCRTRQALLFLFGKKLVLWLPLHIMSAEEMESILNRFRNHGVEVKELY